MLRRDHFTILIGTCFETITLLEILKRRKWAGSSQCESIRDVPNEIAKMLSDLINSLKKCQCS